MAPIPSFRCFREFFSRPFDYSSKINVHRLAHSQHSLQSGISHSALNVRDHLWGKARFLCNEVFGKFPPFTLFLKERNYFGTNGLGFSIHPRLIQKNGIDSVFHYGEISALFRGSTLRSAIEQAFMARTCRIFGAIEPSSASDRVLNLDRESYPQEAGPSEFAFTRKTEKREPANATAAVSRRALLEIKRSIWRKLASRISKERSFDL